MSSSAAAAAVLGGKVYVYIAWSLEAKPERAKRWLQALVGSLIFPGLCGLDVGDGSLW